MAPNRSISYILGSSLLLLGILLFISCLVAFVGVSNNDFLLLLFAVPGRFFLGAFQIAGLFVPFYVVSSGIFLLQKRFHRTRFLILNLGVLPFFTLGLLFQLLGGNQVATGSLVAAIHRTFSTAGGVVLCLILLVAEAMLIGGATGTRIPFSRRERSMSQGEDGSVAEEEADGPISGYRPSASRAIALIPAEHPSRSEESETAFPGPAPVSRLKSVQSYYAVHSPEAGHQFATDSFDVSDAEVAEEYDDGMQGVVEREPSEEAETGDEPIAELPPVVPEEEDEVYFFHHGTFRDGDSPTNESYEGNLETIIPESDDLDLPEVELPENAPSQSIPVIQTVAGAGSRSGGPTSRKTPAVFSPRRKRPVPGEYKVPIEGILDEYEDGQYWEIDAETRKAAEILTFTLEEFQIQAEVTGIRKGPVITMFEMLPAPGVKLAKIVNLADNIALRLAAQSVRIVAPIPGKHAVGIEIPNKRRAIVSFAELIEQDSFWDPKIELPIAVGKDIPGDAQIVDLTKTPHLLIAGATGSGKSVCVNSIICSLLYRKRPDEVKMILIDPKIVELKFYNDIPHLLTPVITDPKRAFQALQYAIYEMERRYSLLDALGVRDIRSYNNRIRQRNLATEPIPYIVIVVDEFADLMATTGKELESTLARLAAMSRAVGIHLVLATQRPSTDVITGLIKANIPSRIAFMVASKVDSRIIIDTGGAEKLLGRGDMLFTSAWDPFPFRMQGAFLSEDEVERIVSYVKTLGEPDYIDDEIFIDEDDEIYAQQDLEDPLMEKAMEIVVSAGKASASYLQRRLKIGYNRAARLVEEMERIGVVGPQNGSKARDILHVPDRVG